MKFNWPDTLRRSLRFLIFPSTSRRRARRCGSHRSEVLETRWVLDGSSPFVVSMGVPNSSGEVLIEFSEPVVGVDLSDFVLERDTVPFPLDGAQFSQPDGANVVITLPVLHEGDYQLSLIAATSGIADLQGDPLLSDSHVQWAAPDVAPTVEIDAESPVFVPRSTLRIAAVGDSLTSENGGSYVTSLRNYFPSVDVEVTTFAAGGRKVSQIRTAWETEVRDQNFDAVIFFGGMNDLIASTQSPQQIFGQLQSLYDEAMALQMQVISVELTPWYQFRVATPSRAEDTIALNLMIADYSAQHPEQMRFVETYDEFLMPGDNYRMNPRYDVGDGLHYSRVGDEALSRLFAPVIEDLVPTFAVENSATLTFSEPIAPLTPGHIVLERNGVPQPFELHALSDSEYAVEFETLPDDSSEYRIALQSAETPVSDPAGNILNGAAEHVWQHDTQSPEAALSYLGDAISSVAISEVQIQFSEPVTGLQLSDFQLHRGDEPVSLSGASLIQDGASAWTLNLGAAGIPDGSYRLTLQSHSGDIVDLYQNPLKNSVSLAWVTLPAPIEVVDHRLLLTGTSGPETINLVVTDLSVELTINGVDLSIDRQDAFSVELSPNGGRDFVSIEVPGGESVAGITITSADQQDTIYVYDSDGNDLFDAGPDESIMTSSQWAASAIGFSRVVGISRHGEDQAVLTDSPADDIFTARPFISTLTGTDFNNNAAGFGDVVAVSGPGNDVANLHGSPGDDQFLANTDTATLAGSGFANTAVGFMRVNALPSAGYDQCEFVGGSGDDRFVSQPHVSAMTGPGFANYCNGFDFVIASGGGGADVAEVYDSSGNDLLETSPGAASISGPGFSVAVLEFPQISVFSRTGQDTALLMGDAGNDALSSAGGFVSLQGPGHRASVFGFSSVSADGAEGTNTARIVGTSGDDLFDSTRDVTRMSGHLYSNSTIRFQQVEVIAAGGMDTAVIRGTSGNDTFTGRSTVSTLIGEGYSVSVSGFDSVSAGSNGGADTAIFIGTALNDLFDYSPGRAVMEGSSYRNIARGFRTVRASAGAGHDRAVLRGTTGVDRLISRSGTGSLTSGADSAQAMGFEEITAIGRGGSDIADLHDTPGNDTFVSNPSISVMSSAGMTTRVSGFPRVNAFGGTGTDTATLTGTTGNDTFTGRADFSFLTTASQVTYVRGYDRVVASGGGGQDEARLFDSSGDDLLSMGHRAATLSGPGFRNSVSSFSSIIATSTAGTDSATYLESSGDDHFSGLRNMGRVTSAGFVGTFYSFRSARLFQATRGINTFETSNLDFSFAFGVGWSPVS